MHSSVPPAEQGGGEGVEKVGGRGWWRNGWVGWGEEASFLFPSSSFSWVRFIPSISPFSLHPPSLPAAVVQGCGVAGLRGGGMRCRVGRGRGARREGREREEQGWCSPLPRTPFISSSPSLVRQCSGAKVCGAGGAGRGWTGCSRQTWGRDWSLCKTMKLKMKPKMKSELKPKPTEDL